MKKLLLIALLTGICLSTFTSNTGTTAASADSVPTDVGIAATNSTTTAIAATAEAAATQAAAAASSAANVPTAVAVAAAPPAGKTEEEEEEEKVPEAVVVQHPLSEHFQKLIQLIQSNPTPQPVERLTTSSTQKKDSKGRRKRTSDHTNLQNSSLFAELLKQLGRPIEGKKLPEDLVECLCKAYSAGIINWYNPQEALAHCTKPGLLHTAAKHSNSSAFAALIAAGALASLNEFNSNLDTPPHLLAMRSAHEEDAVEALQICARDINPRSKDKKERTVVDILKQCLESRRASGLETRSISALIRTINSSSATPPRGEQPNSNSGKATDAQRAGWSVSSALSALGSAAAEAATGAVAVVKYAAGTSGAGKK